jgi:hypothetical protein
MTILDSSKVDLLWKKIAFGVSKTDGANSKSGSNETVSSPVPVYANQIWAQASEIPLTAPQATIGVVQFKGGVNRVQATADTTSTLNLTWKTNLTDWVPPTFDANYSVKVYIGDPQSSGVQIFSDTNDNEYIFDYQAGLLTFLNSIPGTVAANGIYIVGHRYIGNKGITGAGAGAKSTIVSTIADRDAIVGLTTGDIVMVTDASGITTDAGPGEYAVYMWNGSTFILIATQDSAGADAKTASVAVLAASTGVLALSRAGNGARIVSCTVDVTTVFDGTFEFTVGSTADNQFVMSSADHDVQTLGSYVITPTTQLTVTQETQIDIYVTGTATVGAATVTLTYA